MQYDKGIDKISSWVNFKITGPDLGFYSDVIFDPNFPKGFESLVILPNDLLMLIRDAEFPSEKEHPDLRLTYVAVEKGLFRIKIETKNVELTEVFKILVQHVAVKSSLTCLVCGKRGYRKKVLEGWPSLCTTHHVQYVNYLDEVESNGKDESSI
jgi:hypothetical protein